ncbi:hypothetical protein MMC11_000890 [Xylographa trunciseda]|nr:hypothetical protein [Xylographa trunciseda]
MTNRSSDPGNPHQPSDVSWVHCQSDHTLTVRTSSTSLSLCETSVRGVGTNFSTSLLEDSHSHIASRALSKDTGILDGLSVLRIDSRSKEAQLEGYLFHPDNPWNTEWTVNAVTRIPLPGESIFSLETGEIISTPPRRPYSPTRRAEVAYIRSNGGACEECKKSKRACRHRLQELQTILSMPSSRRARTPTGYVAHNHPGTAAFEYPTRSRRASQEPGDDPGHSTNSISIPSSSPSRQRPSAFRNRSYRPRRGSRRVRAQGRNKASLTSLASASFAVDEPDNRSIQVDTSDDTRPSRLPRADSINGSEHTVEDHVLQRLTSSSRTLTEAPAESAQEYPYDLLDPSTRPEVGNHDVVQGFHRYTRQAGIMQAGDFNVLFDHDSFADRVTTGGFLDSVVDFPGANRSVYDAAPHGEIPADTATYTHAQLGITDALLGTIDRGEDDDIVYSSRSLRPHVPLQTAHMASEHLTAGSERLRNESRGFFGLVATRENEAHDLHDHNSNFGLDATSLFETFGSWDTAGSQFLAVNSAELLIDTSPNHQHTISTVGDPSFFSASSPFETENYDDFDLDPGSFLHENNFIS